MKKQNLILKFTYDGIFIIYKNKISYYKLKNSVENHKVINKEIFIKSINELIEKLKINNKFFSENISIIVDSTYNHENIQLIISIFKELSFNKIEFINILDLINTNQQTLVIELNENNFKLYYLKSTYEGQIYFNKPISILDPYLKELINNTKINNIYVYGDSIHIKKLINHIEKKYHVSSYYYSNPKIYPLKQFLY